MMSAAHIERVGYPKKGEMIRPTAILSSCGKYRYELTRTWSDRPPVAFVLLNPSTADASQDDPTIRRCIGFARDWNAGGIVVVNLFALRSTDPGVLRTASDAIGPENDSYLFRAARSCSKIVAGWGNHGKLHGRSEAVRQLVPNLQCLGLTALGEPKHPLYLAKSTPPRALPVP